MSCSYFQKLAWANSSSTTIAILNKGKWDMLPVPLPPSTEQHRIVAKVDKLMSLCDLLEQKSEASLAAHQTLVETLLATLTESADSGELAQNWARLAQHFDSLFTTQSSIDALKQTILQLAVMGKLVPQDPNDEPASVLLKRIAAEKARLVKEGKIKKEKPLPPISEEEKPFALPDGWEWGRLADMFQFLNGYAFKSEWFAPTGVRLLRNINISHGQTKWDDEVYLPYEHQDEYERFKLEVGDVVISLDRPIINTGLKYAIIRECDLPCLLLQRVAKFHSVGNMVSTSFLPLWLESQAFMNVIDPGRSNGVPHISTKQLELTCFPILSLAEQQRIVSKVDELMSLCDQLSARLQASQTTQLNLAEALVEGALS